MALYELVLTNSPLNLLKQGRKHLEKPPSLVCCFFYFEALFSPLCDTCDSKKSTSLLEGARVHAYEKKKTNIVLICHLYYAK